MRACLGIIGRPDTGGCFGQTLHLIWRGCQISGPWSWLRRMGFVWWWLGWLHRLGKYSWYTPLSPSVTMTSMEGSSLSLLVCIASPRLICLCQVWRSWRSDLLTCLVDNEKIEEVIPDFDPFCLRNRAQLALSSHSNLGYNWVWL